MFIVEEKFIGVENLIFYFANGSKNILDRIFID